MSMFSYNVQDKSLLVTSSLTVNIAAQVLANTATIENLIHSKQTDGTVKILPIKEGLSSRTTEHIQPLTLQSIPTNCSQSPKYILANYKFNPEFLARYSIGTELGSGGFGFVINGVHRCDGQEVAIKFIIKDKVPCQSWVYDADLGTVPMEVYLLKNLRHENIIKYLDSYEDARYVYLIMEYHGSEWMPTNTIGKHQLQTAIPHSNPSICQFTSLKRQPSPKKQVSCDLFECIEQCNHLPENIARHVFRQMVSCITYLHSRGVSHRDIKDENIVIDVNYNIKLIDFGSSIILPRPNCLLDRFCGTITYASPEILLGQAYRPEPAEIWSLGVLLYTILYGQTPFTNPAQAIHGRFTEPKTVSSISCQHLLGSMLQKDLHTRATLEEIVHHPWVQYDYP